MKKILLLIAVLMIAAILGACRDETTTGKMIETATTPTTTETSTSEVTTSEESGETASAAIAAAAAAEALTGEETEFVQTGTHDEEVSLSANGGADPSTIVADFGDLITLSVYSERLKATEIYNEDLEVDQTVARRGTVTVEIEANEQGFFAIVDKTTNEELFRVIVAGEDLG